MALGKNLKKKKLIPEAEAKVESEQPTKKQAAAKKKPAAKKASAANTKKTAPAKKTTPKAKTAPKKAPKKVVKKADKTSDNDKVHSQPVVKVESPQITAVPEKVVIQKEVPTSAVADSLSDTLQSAKLPVYIAKELVEKKRNLRKRYQEEIANLQSRASIQFVIIVIGTERYAIEIDNIKEIVPITDISKTPNTPSHIKGIANVRGKTYVVFDLADKFNVKGDEFAKYLLVLNNREINSSLTLSILPSTLKVRGASISSDLQIIEDALLDASYIKGLIQHEEQLIYFLDVIELIKNEKAIVVPDELAQLDG